MADAEYQRKCQGNWIDTFKKWVLPRSEVSENLVLWTAVWTIAASVRRRVYIPRTSGLGSWDCYPYLYVMFVAPPGMRKTTTVGYAIDLLSNVPNFLPPPSFITQAALVSEIVKSPDASIYLTLEEFGDLIIKGGKEMFEFLTSMYDGKKELRQNTNMRGLEFAEKPTINMLAGTTPDWIADNIPKSLIGGGFASRVLWVYEDKLRQRKLWHDPKVVQDVVKYEEPLLADLIHLSNLEGEFTITEECMTKSEAWYQEMETKYKGHRFAGYLNRKHVMTLKVAMCLRLAYSDKLELTWDDFLNASLLVESIEPNLMKVFQGVGKNEFAVEMKDIITYIQEVKKVNTKVFREHFLTYASPAKLQELIDGVCLIGKMKQDIGEDGQSYFLSVE